MITEEPINKLAEMSGKAHSKAFRKILECAMTPEEARFLLELPVHNTDLAAKFGLDEMQVEEKILGLAQRGLLTLSRKGPRYSRDPGTLHDNMLSSASQYIPAGVEDIWMELYEDEEWWRVSARVLSSTGNIFMRVIPTRKAKLDHARRLPSESVVEIARAHQDLISVRRCCCRVGARKCDHPMEVCIQFGRRAEYDLWRSSGRKISADEAVALAGAAEQSGLVPLVTNLSAVERLEYICYCCGCCCMVLNPGIRACVINQIIAPSRFVVTVDGNKCNGCEQCIAQCYFNAIKMRGASGLGKPIAVISDGACFGCGLCQLMCPSDAMVMCQVRPPESIPENISAPTTIVH